MKIGEANASNISGLWAKVEPNVQQAKNVR